MGHPHVCFGYKTALQLLRAAGTGNLAWARGELSKLPEQAPSKNELDAIVAYLESSFDGLELEKPVHIVGAAQRCRNTADYKPHSCSVRLSGRSFYRLEGGICLSNAALSFFQIATQEKSMIPLLELGYELCGTYQSRRTGVPSAYQVPSLTSTRVLRDYAARNSSLSGVRKADWAMRCLADGSASPRETKQALILGLPKKYGGYGLGIPQMNYEISADAAARAISGKRSFRSDLCWPEAHLDVEYQSREMHEGELSRIQDSRRVNALVSMGWTVVGITNDELDSLVATDTIADTLSRHLKKRQQVRFSDYHARKLWLRRQLGLPVGYE